jgi:hypothetical protein
VEEPPFFLLFFCQVANLIQLAAEAALLDLPWCRCWAIGITNMIGEGKNKGNAPGNCSTPQLILEGEG